MPNLKSLKALKKLMQERKLLNPNDLASAGILGAAAVGTGGLLSVANEIASKHDALSGSLGQTGPLETRPTADIAKRLDILKEQFPDESDVLRGALENELKFRKTKEALMNALKEK